MINIMKFIKQNKKGQSLVEFALVIPIFLSLILGMLEFGWIFNGQITLTSAAREGARVAVVYDTEAAARVPVQTAVERSSGVSSLREITAVTKFPTIMDEGTDGVNNAKVTVTAKIDPIVGLFFHEPVNLTASAIMRLE